MTAATVGVSITLFLAWTGFLVGVIKWLLDRNLESQHKQGEDLYKEFRDLKKEVEGVKSEVSKLQRDLPVTYVRHAQFQRCQDECHMNFASIGKKIDDMQAAIGDKFDELRKEVFYARAQ